MNKWIFFCFNAAWGTLLENLLKFYGCWRHTSSIKKNTVVQRSIFLYSWQRHVAQQHTQYALLCFHWSNGCANTPEYCFFAYNADLVSSWFLLFSNTLTDSFSFSSVLQEFQPSYHFSDTGTRDWGRQLQKPTTIAFRGLIKTRANVILSQHFVKYYIVNVSKDTFLFVHYDVKTMDCEFYLKIITLPSCYVRVVPKTF